MAGDTCGASSRRLGTSRNDAVAKPYIDGHPTQLAFAAAALVFAATASRVGRHAVFPMGGRTAAGAAVGILR